MCNGINYYLSLTLNIPCSFGKAGPVGFISSLNRFQTILTTFAYFLFTLVLSINLAALCREYSIYMFFFYYYFFNLMSRFDIRHMTEGRMKGQAFIALPSSARAEKALAETNGFMLQGKPMVIQFARSAQSKE